MNLKSRLVEVEEKVLTLMQASSVAEGNRSLNDVAATMHDNVPTSSNSKLATDELLTDYQRQRKQQINYGQQRSVDAKAGNNELCSFDVHSTTKADKPANSVREHYLPKRKGRKQNEPPSKTRKTTAVNTRAGNNELFSSDQHSITKAGKREKAVREHHYPKRKDRKQNESPKSEVPCPFLKNRGSCVKGSRCDFLHPRNRQPFIRPENMSRYVPPYSPCIGQDMRPTFFYPAPWPAIPPFSTP